MLEDRVERRTAELNQANADLRANNALFESVLDNPPDLTGMRGSDSRYLLVNKIFENWYSLLRNQFLCKEVEDIWSRSVADEFYSRDA